MGIKVLSLNNILEYNLKKVRREESAYIDIYKAYGHAHLEKIDPTNNCHRFRFKITGSSWLDFERVDLFSFEDTLITATELTEVNMYEILEYISKHTNFKKLYVVGNENEDLYEWSIDNMNGDIGRFIESHDEDELNFLDTLKIIFTGSAKNNEHSLFGKNYYEKDKIILKKGNTSVFVCKDNLYLSGKEVGIPCVIIKTGYVIDHDIKQAVRAVLGFI